MMTTLSLLAVLSGAPTDMVATGTAHQTIARTGTQPSVQGPEANFTGRVRVDPLASANQQINSAAAYVTFEPSARSAWHTHPKGQYLVMTSGVGRTQQWGGLIEEIRPGDVVWCPPGIKHWHGAAPDTAMTHLAITGTDAQGKNVEWMEKVSDDQYAGR